jgi:hypothetical protein
VLQVGRREERGGSDGWGPHGSDVRGNVIDGLCKLEEEAPFGKYTKAAQAEWPNGPSARMAAYGRSG